MVGMVGVGYGFVVVLCFEVVDCYLIIVVFGIFVLVMVIFSESLVLLGWGWLMFWVMV